MRDLCGNLNLRGGGGAGGGGDGRGRIGREDRGGDK
jgi:hypothetical protein